MKRYNKKQIQIDKLSNKYAKKISISLFKYDAPFKRHRKTKSAGVQALQINRGQAIINNKSKKNHSQIDKQLIQSKKAGSHDSNKLNKKRSKKQKEDIFQNIEIVEVEKRITGVKYAEIYKNSLSQYEIQQVKRIDLVYYNQFENQYSQQTSEMISYKGKMQQQAQHKKQSKKNEPDFYQQTKSKKIVKQVPPIKKHISYRYEIIQQIGKGSFGQVYKVLDHKTKQLYAVKVIKDDPKLIKQSFIQLKILTKIKQNDRQDISGVVRVKDFLIFRNRTCIFFELLAENLYQLLAANQFKGLSLMIVRIFVIQILNSLNFLNKMKIMHCDIKPQNIALKQWGKAGVKLLDFSSSCYQGYQIYSYIQSRFYRAPQVIFQGPYSMEIDMWSLGCVAAQLRLGMTLFTGQDHLQQLLNYTLTLGPPSEKFKYWNHPLFQQISKLLIPQQIGKPKTIEQIINQYNTKYHKKKEPYQIRKLKDIFVDDDPLFIDFLQKLLVWEPKKRMKPQEALQHPWILEGLPQQVRQLYSIFQTLTTYQSKGKSSKSKSKKVTTKSIPKKQQRTNHHNSRINPQNSANQTILEKKKSKTKSKNKSGPKKQCKRKSINGQHSPLFKS